MIFIEGKIST